MNPSKKVLIIGSGGREQAMAFKLAQSKDVGIVYMCPDPKTPFSSEKRLGIAPENFTLISFL